MAPDDRARLSDELRQLAAYARPVDDMLGLCGFGVYLLLGADGRLKQRGAFANLITQTGDQYYGERATGIASPPNQISGMRLGTGTTTPAKTGAGAAIVTYITASNKAIDATFPQSSLQGASRQIQFKTTWAAGQATANNISEAVLTNETPLTDVAGSAANTIARALLTPTVNKGASDTLAIIWNQQLLGA